MNKEINYNSLTYLYITTGIRQTNFIEFIGPLHIIKEIKNGDKTIQLTVEKQIKFKSKLGQIKSGNSQHKLQCQKDTIKNVQNLYNSRQNVINLFNDYSKIRSDAIYKTKQSNANKEISGVGLKILTPKQLLQRLPIALGQVKAGKNSEILLNEIRQIVYSLYQSKEITKKVYDNIIKSIQL